MNRQCESTRHHPMFTAASLEACIWFHKPMAQRADPLASPMWVSSPVLQLQAHCYGARVEQNHQQYWFGWQDGFGVLSELAEQTPLAPLGRSRY